MFGDDQQDYKVEEQLANTMGITPESLSDLQEQAQYDYRSGFNDIDLLASLKGFTEEAPVAMEVQDSVSEFIAQSDMKIEFNNHGDPYLNAAAEEGSEELVDNESIATLESSPVEVLAKFDQED